MTQNSSRRLATGTDLPSVAWHTSSYSNNGGDCVQVGLWTRSSYSDNGGQCVEATLWTHSSHSDNGGNCVEVGRWTHSSHSNNGGECVEATLFPHQADHAGLVVVRDSKDPDGPVLGFAAPQWSAFLTRVKAGHSPII